MLNLRRNGAGRDSPFFPQALMIGENVTAT
jgi:hypothetical protein